MSYDYTDELQDPIDEDYESIICNNCNGSGEGMHDGTKCSRCKGTGEEWLLKEIDNEREM